MMDTQNPAPTSANPSDGERVQPDGPLSGEVQRGGVHPLFATILSAHGAPPPAPPCRVCGKTELIACYREDAPEAAICVDCCAAAEHADGETGHVWAYDRAERDRVCDHCGQLARNTDHYDHWDEP